MTTHWLRLYWFGRWPKTNTFIKHNHLHVLEIGLWSYGTYHV